VGQFDFHRRSLKMPRIFKTGRNASKGFFFLKIATMTTETGYVHKEPMKIYALSGPASKAMPDKRKNGTHGSRRINQTTNRTSSPSKLGFIIRLAPVLLG
jgi:hypothetical protein